MDYEKIPFTLKDRQKPWTQRQIVLALGANFISQDAYGIECKCLFGIRHEAAKVVHKSGESTYLCRRCLREDGVMHQTQKEQFQQWLDENELVDGRWKPHSNPFDSVANSPDLAYWKDSEGKPVLYKGAIHIVYGKPSTFKSWFAISLLAEADTRIWDFENGSASTLQRLQALGIESSQANGYTVPGSPQEILERVYEYIQTKPEVLIIDGFSGFAAAMNINPEANNEVMDIYNKVFFPLKQAGITVVVLDHLPKDASNMDYPIGAQAKRSQSDVAILLKHTKSPNTVEIFVSKDRHGEISNRCEAGSVPRRLGELTLHSHNESVWLEITPAYSATLNGSEVTQTDAELLSNIYQFVSENPDQTKSSIETSVPGKTERKRKALKQLVEGGYIVVKNVGTAHIHQISKELDLNWKALGD